MIEWVNEYKNNDFSGELIIQTYLGIDYSQWDAKQLLCKLDDNKCEHLKFSEILKVL